MRSLTVAVLASAVLLGLQGTSPAQVPKITVDQVRVGFNTGNDAISGFKIGSWTPVYVDVKNNKGGRLGPADGVVVVETTDSDDMQNYYTLPLPPMEPEEQVANLVLYTRPGTQGSEINVSIKALDGRLIHSKKSTKSNYTSGAPGSFLYVTAGARSSPLRRALHPPKAVGVAPMQQVPGAAKGPGGDAQDPENNADLEADTTDPLKTFAYVSSARELPTRWFGYAAVDMLVLNTGDATFVKELLEDSQNRKEALAEWVQRGGRITISVGRNHQLVKALLDKVKLIAVNPNGTVQRSSLPGVASWAHVDGEPLLGPIRKDQPGRQRADVDLVKLEIMPGKGVEELASEAPSKNDEVKRPTIVQAAAGLGRVILVAFDLDSPPFNDWKGQNSFWQRMNQEWRMVRPEGEVQNNNINGQWNGNSMVGWERDLGSWLQEQLDSFQEVPVISFGWVALFILLYIVVVGPLDYFFLKKVVKRLELTWITFPTVVLVVSAVAYVTAYYLKGNDLRINKVDVVDVVADLDPDTGKSQATSAYGTTWFTLFSPRIQNYTVGVEPASTNWVPDQRALKDAPRNPYGTMVTWMGRPDNIYGGHGGAPSLFRRAYDYAPDAAGLDQVPIQVWSSKSFLGCWQAPVSEEKPLVQAELTRTGANRDHLSGTITSNLPVELTGVVLFYDNRAYDLPNLSPGVPLRVDDKNIGGLGGGADNKSVSDWFNNLPAYLPTNDFGNYRGRWRSTPTPTSRASSAGIIKQLLFNEADLRSGRAANNSYRWLDQGWRLRRKEEVIVFGQAAPMESDAELVSENNVSPSRLWLGTLPGNGTRSKLKGKLNQETYVRAFIPVPPK
jgi:hypothetical protein